MLLLECDLEEKEELHATQLCNRSVISVGHSWPVFMQFLALREVAMNHVSITVILAS